MENKEVKKITKLNLSFKDRLQLTEILKSVKGSFEFLTYMEEFSQKIKITSEDLIKNNYVEISDGRYGFSLIPENDITIELNEKESLNLSKLFNNLSNNEQLSFEMFNLYKIIKEN